ncbi:molybdate transport system ATP-binding protein [Nocardioides exalbidus]|uniref:Molybdate transport system ATP-binding protein n=1 Tax=Nocardioides exalbidus TaxID=402596 RepID=A0A1H4K826_9ACTN|nr:ATP-binding cassette domain-containing protein [Nocardioides exalbidus]SEB54671.1 molybdate transport system ATP-binding protein [Nocardioides exalbidus]
MSLQLDAVVTERSVDIAFEVGDGETVALLGPNGAGKSTVLAVAAGLLRPDRGRVTLDGRPLTVRGHRQRDVDVPPHDRHVSLLAQEPLLFPHLSVLDNVAFGPRSRGRSRAASRDAAMRWLDEVGIAELADRRPRQLSGGQAQRAAVARALASEPRLLLLDEPMAALDVAVTPALRQTLRRVLADRTVVLVTHDALDALLLSDRVVVIDEGEVVESGPSAEVLARPRSAFTAQLAGLNMLVGTWRSDGVHTAEGHRIEGRVVGPAPREGEQAVAVFPPRAVGVYLDRPVGSPRNALEVTISHLEPHSGQIRARADDLDADITPQAAAELDLAPGSRVHFTVKANEVTVYAM